MAAMTDEEQKEQLKSFMGRYGSPIVIGVLLALCAFFGWQWWHKKQSIESANRTVQYQQILNAQEQASADDAAYKKLQADANAIVKEAPDSAQALQSQLVLAKLAFDKKDYQTASKILTAAQSSKVDDEGLKAIVNLRLAYTQIEQNQLDQALKYLALVKNESFTPTVEEARGDIYVAQKKIDEAQKSYKKAWDVLLERKQPRELLQIKLANVGVMVEDPEIESPIQTSAPASAPNNGADTANSDANAATENTATDNTASES
ncbi:Putative negative regulator of RcsB-dependent stress response [Acinetobacter marinus]|uniref:Ancillary SecYEG translocon subunit n=1 Tax=Acinetobacter marinus TaxID=281375 RepID=A0A1G6MJ44_9GAMM|nr:tetratricopeptide repeat protein [Acinetobacter marinus]SDC54995.1 Putative negative regulator of RcsB-dependent stress response [Acinetobacter marinus]